MPAICSNKDPDMTTWLIRNLQQFKHIWYVSLQATLHIPTKESGDTGQKNKIRE